MSTPSTQVHRRPLHERSQSQNNKLAIRVVPYSPPRLDGEQSPASAPSALRDGASRHASLSDDDHHDHPSSSAVNLRKAHPSGGSESALSSSSSLASLATIRGECVSGSIAAEGSRWPGTPALNTRPYPSNIRGVNAPPALPALPSRHNDDPATSVAGSGAGAGSHSTISGTSQHRPLSRRRNMIAIHSDNKTFSLLPQQPDGHLKSPRLSFSTTSISSDPFTDDTPSSPVTSLPEHSRSISPCTLTSTPSPTPTLRRVSENLVPLPESHPQPRSQVKPPSSSPWNYRMVGGLRKVPKTPDLKRAPQPNSSQPLPDPPLPTQSSESPEAPPTNRNLLSTKSSFQSSQSASTTSETTNYKVYGSSSPYLPDNISLAPSSNGSNYQVIGPSSPAPSIDQAAPPSSGSDENYVVHGDPSPSSSSVVRVKQRLQSQYSRESLIVPPLKPARKKSSVERLGFYRSRSGESLRRVGSLASISSILSQETSQSLLSTPAALYLQGAPLAFTNFRQDSWAASNSSPSPAPRTQPPQTHMIAHPHQWSSQLSTVASESEDEAESEPGSGSGPGSPASYPTRRSSGFPSLHSRHMLSISSRGSIPGSASSPSHSRSPSSSVEAPQPTHPRPAHGHRGGPLIRDQDEHGDGLTDLHGLQQRPSRTRLSGFFSSISSDRNLHSSASSRANSLTSSLPAWARLYYGSGERKFVTAKSSDSMFSEYNDSRPPSSFQSGTPSTEHFPPNIYSQRQRPRETRRNDDARPVSSTGSMGITALAAIPSLGLGMGLRKQTSSIWSPHLRHDQRAIRYSIWEPPSVNWSAESGFYGRRNIQVVMFITGFIFPFAWMIAAVLPLPHDQEIDKLESGAVVDASRTDFRRSLRSRAHYVDESQYQGARWWRQLNRYMSLVGLLVIAAVVTLTVLGVRQGWGS